MRLFWQRGYAGTSIADLTRELGISAPSLYAAFGDKQSLFDEAVARYEAAPESVTLAGTTGANMRDVLQRMFDSAAREYASGEHPHGCLVNSSPELGGNRAQNRRITASRLHEVAGDGDPEIDGDALAAYAHALLVGLSSLARDGADEAELRRVTELALRVLPASADS